METYLEFKNRLRKEIWAGNEPYSLVDSHNRYFNGALVDIQRWVPCVQARNVTIHEFCSTYWEDAKTAVEAPIGVVSRVYTIANDEWRDKVYYGSGTFHQLECWGKRLFEVATPENLHLPVLPHGFKHAEKITLPEGMSRARVGKWAIHRGRLYLAPFIQANEKIVIEWDGIKKVWADTDGVDEELWGVDYEEAIKHYVLWYHERFHGDTKLAEGHKEEYDKKLSDLIWQCRENTRQQQDKPCPAGNEFLTAEMMEDDAIPNDSSAETSILWVADWGQQGAPLEDVVDVVTAEGTDNLLLLGGDNIYSGDFASLLANWSGFSNKKVLWGNHDWDNDPTLANFLAVVGSQGNNSRYFRKVAGPVEFFCISTDPREPDSGYVNATTTIENGIMMQWLKTYLALSNAYWKIVVGHHGPYMSDINNTPGNGWLRAPYKAWGADLYLNGHGHNAEIVTVDGFPYVTHGLGGHSIRNFGSNTEGSILFQYNADYGFLKLQASCDELKLIFKNRLGQEVHEHTLTK